MGDAAEYLIEMHERAEDSDPQPLCPIHKDYVCYSEKKDMYHCPYCKKWYSHEELVDGWT